MRALMLPLGLALAACAPPQTGARGKALLDPSSAAHAFTTVCLDTGARHTAMAEALSGGGWVTEGAFGIAYSEDFDLSFKAVRGAGGEGCEMVARTDSPGALSTALRNAGERRGIPVAARILHLGSADYVSARAVAS